MSHILTATSHLCLADMGNLRTLDLSFNVLRSVPEGLDAFPVLDTIYFVQNKISKISGFTSCTTLRSLELGGNKIRVSRKSGLIVDECSSLVVRPRKSRTWGT